MQHVEFFHRDHFEFCYHRQRAGSSLSPFIDFFWETDFEPLYQRYPGGFSDALFPNVGYTYLINLGTPFVMQLGEEKFEMRTDGFLPRHKAMICHHSAGNKIFGIKFRVSPVLLQKKINFSEYKGFIFPLSYLIDSTLVEKVKRAAAFQQRVQILTHYYEKIISGYGGSMTQVNVVTKILHDCDRANDFTCTIESLAGREGISVRTLQRYFESTTGITSKQALQILRIRKAVEKLAADDGAFHYSQFGYYDYSHFYKHLKQFLSRPAAAAIQPRLSLLKDPDRTKKGSRQKEPSVAATAPHFSRKT